MSVALTPSEKLLVEFDNLFSDIGSSEGISGTLKTMFIAEIRVNDPSAKRGHRDVAAMIWAINKITKFVRTLGDYLPTKTTNKDILKIWSLHKRIDFEQFSDCIFSGLDEWVYYDEDRSPESLAYITKVANSFQEVSELLDACEEYKTQRHEE